MAQLLKPAASAAQSQPRISQLLPTVKCSTCSQPVPFNELGEHVCQSPPPLPTQPSKPAPSLISSKLQNLIPHRTATPTQQQPMPAAHRRRAPLADVDGLSDNDPFQRIPPTMNNITLPTPRVNSPAAPSSVPLHRQQSPGQPNLPVSLSSNRPLYLPERVSTPVRTVDGRSIQPPKTPPSTALPNPFDSPSPPPVLGRPRGASLARRDLSPAPPQHMPLPPPIGRLRTPSNAGSTPPTVESRPRAPSSARRPALDPQRRPSLEPPRPSFDSRQPSFDGQPPSLEPHRPSFDGRRPSIDGQRPSLEPPRPSFDGHRPSTDSQRHPSIDAPRPSLDRRASPAPSGHIVKPPPRHSSGMPVAQGPPSRLNVPRMPPAPFDRGKPGPDIDTKTGGEAGMAGVGRRGFAALGPAPLLNPMNHGPGATGAYGVPMHQRAQQSLRPNAPGYLDIDATMKNVMRAATTPPLSPNSLHSRSPVSPHPASPISPSGSTTPTGAFPGAPLASGKPHQFSVSPDEVSDHVRIASPSRTPSPVSNPFNRRFSYESEVSASDGVHVPFLDAYKNKKHPEDDGSDDDESVYTTQTSEEHGRSKSISRHSTATESEVGLAYADDDEDDTPVVTPLNVRKSSNASTVKFPTMSSRDNVRRPVRKDSAGSMFSASSGEGPSRSRSTSTTNTIRGGALERAMETLLEEGASVSLTSTGSVLASMSKGKAKAQRSNTVPGPAPEHKPPKPPTRSHTSPAHGHSDRVSTSGETSRTSERVKRQRPCARCNSKIENGRWIEMDGGRVLCEQCWKNLYLPKCRRCNLPIEKQAVSSSDGQLKGKYHRDCFNCHTCHKPFPDKEFYVFDGKPLCAYHYHEANDSLCSATTCGQPIEGPCAVTHSGRRYHPQHLLCEYEDGCSERLAEYWEIDGQMFCDRHGSATAAARLGPQLRGGALEAARDSMRAMKRMTLFIDLGATPDEDEYDEVDIL